MTKTVITKNGDGVLFFPNEETRNEAAKNLENTCSITVQDKNYKTIKPKLKISGIPKQYFDKVDAVSVENEILDKNCAIEKIIKDE